jgi:hypothetical protein
MLLTVSVCADDPLDAPVPVPPGITYTAAPAEVNHQAAERLRQMLASRTAHCVGDVFMCGPFLWRQLKDDPAWMRAGGFGTHVLVPTTQGQLALAGHGFQNSNKAAHLLEDWLRSQLRGETFQIRKLNGKELAALWAILSYDIEEPVLVVDSGPRQFIFHFVHDEVFYIDDFTGLR